MELMTTQEEVYIDIGTCFLMAVSPNSPAGVEFIKETMDG